MALSQASDNLKDEQIDLVLADVSTLSHSHIKADTVLTNPPFGTKNKGIDLIFLKFACSIANVVYTLHKSTTRDFILNKGAEFGMTGVVIAQMKFDLPKSYKMHKNVNKVVLVDLIRFEKVRLA